MKTKRLNTLTSLRFFAAAMIVTLHMNGTFWPAISFSGLTTGVSFFFVLSGFILTMVYGEIKSAEAAKRFYIARIARIWPVHLFAIGLLFTITDAGFPRWRYVIPNVLLIQSWIPNPDWYFALNGVSWSISTELAFYAIFPLLSRRLATTWHVKLMLAVAAIFVCAAMYPIFKSADKDAAELFLAGLLYINPAARVFEFIIGMLAAQVYVKVAITIKGGTRIWTAAEVGTCCIVAVGIHFALPAAIAITPYSPQFAEWYLQAGLFWAVALLIFTFAIGRGLLSRLLSMRLFVFLGEISFTMYMIHQIIIRGMVAKMNTFTNDHPTYAGLLFIVIIIPASAIVFWLFERPARNIVVRLLGGRITPPFVAQEKDPAPTT